MLIIEADADKFDCPMTLASHELEQCRGKKCMAWRWDERDIRHVRGYCGMAGKPEIPPSVQSHL